MLAFFRQAEKMVISMGGADRLVKRTIPEVRTNEQRPRAHFLRFNKTLKRYAND